MTVKESHDNLVKTFCEVSRKEVVKTWCTDFKLVKMSIDYDSGSGGRKSAITDNTADIL